MFELYERANRCSSCRAREAERNSARGGGVAIGGQSLMCSIEDGIAHFVTRREIG